MPAPPCSLEEDCARSGDVRPEEHAEGEWLGPLMAQAVQQVAPTSPGAAGGGSALHPPLPPRRASALWHRRKQVHAVWRVFKLWRTQASSEGEKQLQQTLTIQQQQQQHSIV